MKYLKYIKVSSRLVLQYLMVIAAFSFMVVIGNHYGARIVNNSLSSYSEEAIVASAETLTTYLRWHQTSFEDAAFMLEYIYSQGKSNDEYAAEIEKLEKHLLNKDSRYGGYLNIYVVTGSMAIGANILSAYPFEQQSWYAAAIEDKGTTHFNEPYHNTGTGEWVIPISRALFDRDGNYFGVLVFDVQMSAIAAYVKDMRLLNSGYGALLDPHLCIVVHPNESVIGQKFHEAYNEDNRFTPIAERMFDHQDVDAYPVVSFTGEKSVFFSRQLFNGWFVYLATPYDDFYGDADALFAVLSGTGLFSTLILCAVLTFLHAKKARSDEASRQKSSFLANMSHEIRTPMNAIIGMSEILTRSNLSQRDMECVNDISESAHSLLSIINDILDMSKIESGKMSLNPVHYDFPSMMDNVVSMFTYVAKKKGLAFRFEAEGELPKYLYGDDVRLRQMLINLCGNAVKFTEEGYVWLKYSKYDSNMVIEIQDTGIGIAKEDIPTIFNDYEQSSTSKNRYISGSGLGLAICKRFAEMMGGNIELQSEYGKGSCFTMTIPIVMGDPSEVSVKDHWHEEKTIRVDNANILVVDDNEYNLKVAHGLLNLYGIDADMADSGRKAIAKVLEKEYDIVFMDHMMPDVDGIETTAEIRKQGGKYKDIAIIALTANAIKGAKEMFLANGFNGFISKPIEMPVLIEALIKWLPADKVREITQEAKAANGSGTCDDFLQAMSNIDEIDTETGLRRVNGLTDMYIGNLKLFHQKLAADGEKMSAFLRDGDIKAFSITVHAMKSALAGVGAAGLSDAAFRLETAAKDDAAEYCKVHFPAFIESLLALHSKLSLVFPEEESGREEVKEKGDVAYLTENVQKAIEAVNDFNADGGTDIISKLTAYDFGGDIDTKLTAALTALRQYNYDEAKNCLAGLLSGL